MSETNEKSEGGIKTFFKQLFSKKEESPGRRSSKNREGNDDFPESIPIAPKRKSKRTAPQPPMVKYFVLTVLLLLFLFLLILGTSGNSSIDNL